MMKAGSKRRRTHHQVEEDKRVKAQREAELNQKLAAMASMEARLQQMESQAQNNQAAADILNDLVQKGLAEVDESGNVKVLNSGN